MLAYSQKELKHKHKTGNGESVECDGIRRDEAYQD